MQGRNALRRAGLAPENLLRDELLVGCLFVPGLRGRGGFLLVDPPLEYEIEDEHRQHEYDREYLHEPHNAAHVAVHSDLG